MNEAERRALTALTFNWAPTQDDVWEPLAVHVDELNNQAEELILASFAEAAQGSRSPLGVAVLGPKGSGKTHLLRRTRENVQRSGGYFFLVGVLQGKDFWQNIAHTLLSGLWRENPEGDDQVLTFVRRLAELSGTDATLRDAVTGVRPLTRPVLDRFMNDVLNLDRHVGRACQDTARALVMIAVGDSQALAAGEAYLTSQGEAEPGEFAQWGIRSARKPAQLIASEISQLLSLTGPILLAVDQIDTLVAQMPSARDRTDRAREAGEQSNILLEQIGDGLMALRESLRRTLVVVTCFYSVWDTLARQAAVGSVADRFRAEYQLAGITTARVAETLAEAWLASRYADIGFAPPYPTWPVLPEAFAAAPKLYTPRALLKRINEHAKGCLVSGELTELHALGRATGGEPGPEPVVAAEDEGKLASLDARFDVLIQEADIASAMSGANEDTLMPALLEAGLRAWVIEQSGGKATFSVDLAPGEKKSAFHARLRLALDEETEDALHWSFRAIAGPHFNTVGRRIEHLRVISAIGPESAKRKACVLRTGRWSTGAKTELKIASFRAMGGTVVDVEGADLAVFDALRVMFLEKDPALWSWLILRRPASGTLLFQWNLEWPEELSDLIAPMSDRKPSDGEWLQPPEGDDDLVEPSGSPPANSLTLGSTVDQGTAVQVQLESLRKHTVIFAGSGSGKTVLIRRIIEECALHGVSSIVLDPNNDLARLGDAWPESPLTWGKEDAGKARDYLANTEVVVWTPRREAGRPLSLQPLPDFAAVLDDSDEFNLALDSAVATLAPRARMNGPTAKAERGRAVLREALSYLARRGGSGLVELTEMLADLPDEVTSLAKARMIAQDLSQTLTAAMINDPLFGGSGVPLNPEVLLTPAVGRRARISVISFVGLPSNEQRQSFVNQLQMALFAWIKQHPAGDRPLGGLFVMDEAQTLAPSGAMTACTGSTLALASQARKYGLGLVFATQSPKGIHNQIAGNAATQFYGFLNSPVQIAAAKELAAAKSSAIPDISRLSAGQFYAVGEGLPFQKMTAPMCLSHHPASPLSTEEVLVRARSGA